MIRKTSRIKKNEFELINKKGKVIKSESFYLRFLQNNLKNSQFSVVLSKKTTKNAVTRNKTRRRFYSILRKNENNIKKQGFFVVFPNKSAINADFKKIESEIINAFLKI